MNTSKYKITGVDRNGKRFRLFTSSYMHAMGINLWSGSVWMRSEPHQKWRLIKRV